MSLSELKPGQMAVVERVDIKQSGEGLARRLEAMGLIANRPIQVLRKAWFGGPLHIRVGLTTEIAIRRQEAESIMIKIL